MTGKDVQSNKTGIETAMSVIAVATFIIAGPTLLHMVVGIILLLYLCPSFIRPASLREEVLYSVTMALGVVLLSAPLVEWGLRHHSLATKWEVVLVCEWLVVGVILWISKLAYERSRLQRRLERDQK